MAEIRKFDPAAGNAIAQALREAMGDPVRPRTPGTSANPEASTPTTEDTQTTWLSVRIGETDQINSDPIA